jgi:hypothetical protein
MMYTSILLLALSPAVPTAEVAGGLSWQRDYHGARQQSGREAKPLAVVLGAGPSGWRTLARDGSLGNEAREMLASSYICVHINTATPEGKRLARQFGMPSGLGIVISNRTGELQAFWHEGDLADADLVHYLTKYADPQHVTHSTDTNPPEQQTGYYPSAASSVPLQPSYFQPSYFQPSFCPS